MESETSGEPNVEPEPIMVETVTVPLQDSRVTLFSIH